MTRRHHRLLPLLAGSAALLLTGCGGLIHPTVNLEQINGLQLWQKVASIAVFTLFSEDLAYIAAGILASKGVMTFGWALFAVMLGTCLADYPLYVIGRLGGLTLLRRRPFRWFISERQIHQTEDLFQGHGAKLICTSRLIPGSRVPVYVAAGLLNYPLWKFSFFMILSGALASLGIAWVSMLLGEVVFEWVEAYESYLAAVAIAVVILVWIIVKLIEILATRRSRLVFLSRWRKFIGRPRRPVGED